MDIELVIDNYPVEDSLNKKTGGMKDAMQKMETKETSFGNNFSIKELLKILIQIEVVFIF